MSLVFYKIVLRKNKYMCHRCYTIDEKKHRLALKNTGSRIIAAYLIFHCSQSKAALFS